MANKPGPLRNPNSRRGQAEIRKKQRLALAAGAANQVPSDAVSGVSSQTQKLPTCPKWLPKRVAEKWCDLVIDMAAAGIVVQALDSRSIALAAGYEADLADLEEMSGGDIEPEHLMQNIRLKNSCRKDLLAALMAIDRKSVV